MIASFADSRTRDLFVTGDSRVYPSEIISRALRKLDMLDATARLDDLRVPPGNRLHALEGKRSGQHAIAINAQWRICFRFMDGDAHEVEIIDYH